MRSLLIASADEKRLAEALASGADAVIVDLALAAPENRAAARVAAARFLKQARARDGAPALVIGVNGLDSGETDADLDAVMGSAPDAILLPGSLGAASVQQLSAKLATPAPFGWPGNSRFWPRRPPAWRRLTRRSPPSPTREACAPKRPQPGATAFQPSWRSIRPSRGSSTRRSQPQPGAVRA